MCFDGVVSAWVVIWMVAGFAEVHQGGIRGFTLGARRLRQRCWNPGDYLDVVPEDLQPMQQSDSRYRLCIHHRS